MSGLWNSDVRKQSLYIQLTQVKNMVQKITKTVVIIYYSIARVRVNN